MSQKEGSGSKEIDALRQILQFMRDPLNISTNSKPEEIEISAKWSPEHIPCILAPARDSASLLVWIIVDLYGKIANSLLSPKNVGNRYKESLSYLTSQ